MFGETEGLPCRSGVVVALGMADEKSWLPDDTDLIPSPSNEMEGGFWTVDAADSLYAGRLLRRLVDNG